MSLFKQWQDLIENQTDATFNAFWEKYSATETKIYADILENHTTKPEGTFQQLVDKYEADPVIFMGFLDGIQTSLNNPTDLEPVDESSAVSLDIDFEKLFYNMLVAEADYLFGLEQWDKVLDLEVRKEIANEYRRSRTVVKEKLPGRNDPCPCGSGKKYKKCCGAN